MSGFLGRLLRVDLTEHRIWEEALDPYLARAFVGGSALAARLAYAMVDAATDPLGSENPFILMTGPLVGTSVPSAGRYSVGALSPLTGLWGEANSGGFFGPELRFAGYDGVIVTGMADAPLWLSIVDGHAELRDAEELWGLDSYATQRAIQTAMGDSRVRVACIGPAGEHQARMACVMNDHGRAAGRAGLGAVLGAKRLKAIAVRGHDRVPVADADALRAVVRQIHAGLDDDMTAMSLRLAGTAGYVDMGLMYGDVPIRYFQQGEWESASDLSGVLMVQDYQNRNVACYRCPIACGRETRAPRFQMERVDGPEYETVAALGTLLMVDDLQAVIYAGHLCNLYGLDTISVGVTLGLACELVARGLMAAQPTDAPTPRYGDASALHGLIPMIARREGLGALLAEGNRALAEAYGVPELAVHVHGLEIPMHDPRAFSGMAVSYALSPRGGCHMQGDMYSVDTGQGPPFELGVEPGDRFESSEGKGRTAARQMLWRGLYNALTLCQFQNPGVDLVLQALNAVTGWQVERDELLILGQRGLTLKRLLNLRRGLKREGDRLPPLLLQPLEGGTQGQVPDVDVLLQGAYRELGWDPLTGQPLPATVETLGLADLIAHRR